MLRITRDRTSTLVYSLTLVACLALCLTGPTRVGCLDGGANLHQQRPGNSNEGINIGFGEIAVHPSGDYFVSRSENHLVYANLKNHITQKLPGIQYADRLAFSYTSHSLFLTIEKGNLLLRYSG